MSARFVGGHAVGVLWLRSALFALLLPGTVLLWVPTWLLSSDDGTLPIGAGGWLGIAPLVVGACGLLWCIVDFGRTGRGTLAPVDPPRFIVRTGLYRVVRNPMYVSVLTALVGEVLVFRSMPLAAWLVLVAAAFHLFVVTYEEPTLRRLFGEEYEAYCRSVPRWRVRWPLGGWN